MLQKKLDIPFQSEFPVARNFRFAAGFIANNDCACFQGWRLEVFR